MGSTAFSLVFLLMMCFAASIDAFKVVCYFTNWAQYRPDDGKFLPYHIDPKLCSHIIYAFAKLDGNKLAPYEWNDDKTNFSEGMYSQVIGLKKLNPALKVLLSVGGWNMGSAPFTKMVATNASRHEFCFSSEQFLKKHGFDGLDIAWEYPTQRGSPPGDRRKFTLLIQTCKKVFSGELILSAAVEAGGRIAEQSYDVKSIAKELNFISLMTYDMRGVWDEQTGHHAPLHSFTQEPSDVQTVNIEKSVDWWLNNGAPASKLLLGLPAYARTFTVNEHATPMIGYTPVHGAGFVGHFTREAGFLAYYEVCNEIRKGESRTKVYKNNADIAVTVKGNQWFGYDNEKTITAITNWLKSKNLGGAMFWALDLDDFSGKFCNKGRYPLLRAINKQLNPTQLPSNTILSTRNPPVEPIIRYTTTAKAPNPNPTIAFILPDGPCKNNGLLVSYPGDCAKYLVCDNYRYIEMDCPDSLHFNQDIGSCDNPENVPC